MDEYARLNRVDFRAVDGRRRPRGRPRPAAVVAALEVHAPHARALRRFRAAPGDNDAIGKTNRFVLDWAEHAAGQPAAAGPRTAAVTGCPHHAPPPLRRWT